MRHPSLRQLSVPEAWYSEGAEVDEHPFTQTPFHPHDSIRYRIDACFVVHNSIDPLVRDLNSGQSCIIPSETANAKRLLGTIYGLAGCSALLARHELIDRCERSYRRIEASASLRLQMPQAGKLA